MLTLKKHKYFIFKITFRASSLVVSGLSVCEAGGRSREELKRHPISFSAVLRIANVRERNSRLKKNT